MNVYTKVISLQGSYSTKEHKKTKNHGDKTRPVQESTVAKVFKEGDTMVIVYFKEQDKTLELTSSSDPEDIKRYLGKNFL